MSEIDRMRIFELFEGEISESDFTPEELEEFFAAVRGVDETLSPAERKARYFAFYDDVKDKSLKRQDW